MGYRARQLMRSNALQTRWRRKFVHTTDSRHELPVAGNVLARRFKPARPNEAWVSDMTYIRTRSGWLYLAVVLDLFSRKIVGWAMTPSMPAELVCAALSMAIASRMPAPGLLVHSDLGSQYASEAHTSLLKRHRLVCSMSRKGSCRDNAVMERFFLNLKWSESGKAIAPWQDFEAPRAGCVRTRSLFFPMDTWEDGLALAEVDCDKCKTARHDLVEAFMHSVWRPTDIALAAARAQEPIRILRLVARRKGGPQVIAAIDANRSMIPEPWQLQVGDALRNLSMEDLS